MKNNELLGYKMDTFCTYGNREYAKQYNGILNPNRFLKEAQEQVDWHVNMGNLNLKGVVVEIEQITKDKDIPKQYTLVN